MFVKYDDLQGLYERIALRACGTGCGEGGEGGKVGVKGEGCRVGLIRNDGS